MARRRIVGVALTMVLVAPSAWGQQSTTAGIAGVVRDTSGAVLPGVTVEVASPALIEKVRTAVTESQGRYNISELRPGTYSVTFTLTGFATLRHEALELSTGVTATANAEMKLGALEETITVAGTSVAVDVHNVRAQQVLKASVLDTLPSSQRDISQMASLTLGATSSTPGRNDVGGDKGEMNTALSIHGGRGDDGKVNFDGMNTNSMYYGGGGQMRVWKFNTMGMHEIVVETGANSIESETGGANINVVPREGGNTFRLYSILSYTNGDLASGKVPESLIARGSAPNQNTMKKVYDYGVGLGGPIVKDRLWFYSANRAWGSQAYSANNYFNKSADWRFYEPDLSRRAYTDVYLKDAGVRLTGQASAKHKVTFYGAYQGSCNCWSQVSAGSPFSPESINSFQQRPMFLLQPTWTYPANERLLFQAGASFLHQPTLFAAVPRPRPDQISILELTTGRRYNALPGSTLNHYDIPDNNDNFNQRLSAAYVTGSHAFKIGMQSLRGRYDTHGETLPNNGLNYTFRNGVPVSLTQFADPFVSLVRIRNVAVFAQDQWTVRKFTVNYGLRYDHFWAFAPAITVPAGPFVPERSYPELRDLPSYHDLAPRLGVAYDLFGNGKTAVKASWGRYVMGQGGGKTKDLSPGNALVTLATRAWNDSNGNYVPDCVLTNLFANGECGQVDNLQFGQPQVNLTWPEEARTGWSTREYNHQYSVAIQHELRPGFGVNVGYFRTDWRNQLARVNTAVGPEDYTSYCITAPTDTRLGDFSGRSICGLYDIDPGKFGRVQNILMLAKDVPGASRRPEEIFNGVDVAVNATFARGRGLVAGGVTVGRSTFDYCWQNELPNVLQDGGSPTLPRTEGYCKVQSPWWSGVGSQIKLQGVYPLPWDFVVGATYKHVPGIPIQANYVATNTQVAPALGRNLSACPVAVGACSQVVTVGLLPSAFVQGNLSGVVFDNRLNQTDLRLTRMFRVGKGRMQGIAELYNVFNARPSQANTVVYGATWLRPTLLLGGRLFKFGTQIDF